MAENTTKTNNSYENALFGRRQIFSTVDELTEDNIIYEVNSALSYHVQNLLEEDYLYWYRRGLQPILNRTKEVRPEINNKVTENHADEIVSFKNGYFLTQPAFYVSRKEDEEVSEKVEELNEYLYESGKQVADNQIVDWFHTVGKGVLYVKPGEDDEPPVVAYALDPRSAFVVYSLEPGNKPVMGINTVVSEGKVRVDAFTKDKVFKLSGIELGTMMTDNHNYTVTVTAIDEVKSNVLGEIPIIEYQYNSVNMGAFESVIPLLNAVNNVMSNRMDGVEQFIQSLVVATNVDLEEGVTANDIRQAGMIVLKSINDNKADFKILSEQLNQSETQVLVDYLYQQILTICGMPNSTKGKYSTSDTGTAVLARDGWYQADTVARNTEDLFIKANKQFDKILIKILKQKKLLDIDINDFKLQFVRNETVHIQSKAQALSTLLGAGVSPELSFGWSGVSNDPVSDVARSEKYLKMIWGDPDFNEKVIEQVGDNVDPEGGLPATEGMGGANEEQVAQAMEGSTQGGEPEENKQAKGKYWVSGYWRDLDDVDAGKLERRSQGEGIRTDKGRQLGKRDKQ